MSFVNILRDATARAFLLVGMLGPAIGLAVAPYYWTTSKILQDVLHLPVMVTIVVLVVILVLGAILVITKRYRDFGYILGAVFYGFLVIVAISALFAGLNTSLLILALPLLVWIYVAAAVSSSKKLSEEEIQGGQ